MAVPRRATAAFDPWVQYLAARGYAVFQPNFRGSDGFGKAFAESGYGEWGRKMQDDLSDGVKALVDQGIVDPARVCIVGASYGGYAALAGAALTPDLYKCAVSIAGISRSRRLHRLAQEATGAPTRRATRTGSRRSAILTRTKRDLREVSPLAQSTRIKIPILLIHGDADDIVPYRAVESHEEGARQVRAQDRAASRCKDEGHSDWSRRQSRSWRMTAVGQFLWQNLGPGFGRSTEHQQAMTRGREIAT